MDRIASTIYATNFQWWDSTGTVRELHDYYGKAVVISFWGTWADQAVSDVQALATLQKQYRDSNVVFIGVTLQEPGSTNEILARVRQYCSDHGMAYQQVLGNSELAASYDGIYQMPSTVLLSRQDKVLKTLVGAQGLAQLEVEIRKAIAYMPPK